MIIHNIEQRSPEWYEIRKGKITASNAHRLLTTAKRKTYQIELLAEILTGQMTEHYISEAMQWGIDNEPYAVIAFHNDHPHFTISKPGFITSEEYPNIGCSPDFVINEGFYPCEVKCLSSKNHLEAYLDDIDSNHVAQLQFQMFVMDKDWGNYVGFDPRMPAKLHYYKIPMSKDDKMRTKFIEGINEVNCFIDGFLMDNGLTR